MLTRWLDIYLHFSAWLFSLKRKLADTSVGFFAIIFYTGALIFLEIIFLIISLPFFILIPPKKLQLEQSVEKVSAYTKRRRVGLTTLLSGGGILLIKFVLLALVPALLIGAAQLFADTQSWLFTTPSNYTYDTSTIEITGGVAQLIDTGTTTSGTGTNPGFDSGSTGWTFKSWLDGGKVTGHYHSTGGNPGGYIDVAMADAQNKTMAGFWYEPFTTTVSSPDTATVSFDWASLAASLPGTPTDYEVYVFVDTSNANPTLGQQVWSSGQISGTTGWTNTGAIDITSKVTTARTYYLKVVAYLKSPASPSGTYSATVGFDNIQVAWSKTTHIYASNSPSIYPNTSLSAPKIVSWNSFC